MKTDNELDQIINSLPREIAPQRDLWAGIELRLDEQEQTRKEQQRRAPHFFTGSRWAAMFALALVGALWWGEMGLNPGQSTQSGDFLQIPADQQIVATYESIKAERINSLGQVSADLGNWQYQMAVWDQAISEVQGALYYYPEEPALLAQMQGIYQQQVEYLQLVSSLDTNNLIWMENEQ